MNVRIGGEAEFQRIGGLIGRQPVINEGAHIARPAGASERQFMHCRAPRFMRRVCGDGDDLDSRRMLGAPAGGLGRALQALGQVHSPAARHGFLADGGQAQSASERFEVQALVLHVGEGEGGVLGRHARGLQIDRREIEHDPVQHGLQLIQRAHGDAIGAGRIQRQRHFADPAGQIRAQRFIRDLGVGVVDDLTDAPGQVRVALRRKAAQIGRSARRGQRADLLKVRTGEQGAARNAVERLAHQPVQRGAFEGGFSQGAPLRVAYGLKSLGQGADRVCHAQWVHRPRGLENPPFARFRQCGSPVALSACARAAPRL